MKSWTRRYFILNKQSLCYFRREQEDGSADDLHPLGRIFLSDVVKIETDGVEKKKAFVFALHTKKRAVLLQAANVDDREAWASAIRRALESEGEAERKDPFRRTLRKLAPGKESSLWLRLAWLGLIQTNNKHTTFFLSTFAQTCTTTACIRILPTGLLHIMEI